MRHSSLVWTGFGVKTLDMENLNPSLALIEVNSFSHGYYLANELGKISGISILQAMPCSPGRFYLLVNSDQETVQKAWEAFQEIKTADKIFESCLLLDSHPQLLKGYFGLLKTKLNGALGVIETRSLSSAFLAANSCLQTRGVDLIEIRNSRGLGDRSLTFVTGNPELLRGCLEKLNQVIEDRSLLDTQIISSPNAEFLKMF